jgi:uncharacterized protein
VPPGENPFRFGDLALDDAFTDREPELAELCSDVLNGQNVVVFAPRRFGKTSLVWRAAQQLTADGVLIAQVDLMKAPTKERLAEKLARSIYEDIATPLFRARERAAQVFRGLRIAPVMTIDPEDGSLGFSFRTGHAQDDLDATLERLFELPAQLAADRGRRAALFFDEFQEILDIDPSLPRLMRSVFQEQPDVAHVYLGSKRSMMARLFNDANEPFWRSAKHVELGVISAELFRPFIHDRFETTGKSVEDETVSRVLQTTGGHPYGTQELCYSLWEETPDGGVAATAELEQALERVLLSEHAHFARIWEEASRSQRLTLLALAAEPLEPITADYRRRHGLPAPSTVQKALDTLVDDEIVWKEAPGDYQIGEPFLAEWIVRNAT